MRYFIIQHPRTHKEIGRAKGNHTHRRAAMKALTSLCKDKKKCHKRKVVVRETNSDVGKLYEVKRINIKPVVVNRGDKDIVYRHKVKATYLGKAKA